MGRRERGCEPRRGVECPPAELLWPEAAVQGRHEEIDRKLWDGPAEDGEVAHRSHVVVATHGDVPVLKETVVDEAGAGKRVGDGGIRVTGAAQGDAGYRVRGQQQRGHLTADDADVLVGGDARELCQRPP
jgi:hypothetical protein